MGRGAAVSRGPFPQCRSPNHLCGSQHKRLYVQPTIMLRTRSGCPGIAPAPARQPALADLDPDTGRARLSYRRAAEVFKEATGGWTLHQLRHSRLTHLAEAGIALPILMAKKPPHQPEQPGDLRQTHLRRRRRSHRSHRPRPPALIYPPTAFRSLPPTVCPALLLTGERLEITDPGESEDVGVDWADPRALTSFGAREATEPWSWHGPARSVTGGSWGGCLEVIEWVLTAGRFPSDPGALDGRVLIIETSEELLPARNVGWIVRALGERGILAAVDAEPCAADSELRASG